MEGMSKKDAGSPFHFLEGKPLGRELNDRVISQPMMSHDVPKRAASAKIHENSIEGSLPKLQNYFK